MSKVKIDTDKVKSLAEKMKKNIETFEQDATQLYNELNNLQHVWRGPDAEVFIKTITNQKKDIGNMILVMEQYVIFLNQTASSIEEKMSN